MTTRTPPRPTRSDHTLITSEPSSRSVFIHRLVSLVTALLLAGVASIAIADPLNLFEPDPATVPSSGESDVSAAGPTADTQPAALGSETVAGDSDDTEDDVVLDVATPTAGTRFVDLPTTRMLDTREGGAMAETASPPIDPGSSVMIEIDDVVPSPDATMIALSVNVAMAQGPGPITVSAGADPIIAIDVAKAGQMTTNLVLVPWVPDEPVEVTTAGGGHLVVDLVGYFEPVAATAAGRFVPVATQRVARLVTEVDGREAVVSPLANPALPASGASSVLLRITADVGGEGGMVRLGQDLEALPNTMMWAATSGDDRTRQGVAIVSLSELDELAFTYNGGSVLDLDVLGYFTDESALEIDSGLFTATSPVGQVVVEVAAGQPSTVNVAELLNVPADRIGAVVTNVFATAEGAGDLFVLSPAQERPGSATVELGAGPRFGFTVTEVDDRGNVIVESDADASVTVVVPGYFSR